MTTGANPAGDVVFETAWFRLLARASADGHAPHYVLDTADYVCIVPVTPAGELVLVRQFRPALGRTTLELPSGHVDDGMTADQAARAELLEETGYRAGAVELLGTFSPDTGRMSNRLWCFHASDVEPAGAAATEPGIECVLHAGGVQALLAHPDFASALHVAALLMAAMRGRVAAPGATLL